MADSAYPLYDQLDSVTGEDNVTAEEDDLLVDEMYDPDAGVECTFVTGAAGTGKTYKMRQEIAADPRAGILCATTGVAAVNLGTVTLNSVLRYFNTESLTDLYVTGRLTHTIQLLAQQYRSLMIDEISMMDADQLDLIYQASREANQRGKHKIAITLTGDFCQLPPVKARWAFEAQNWDKFAANIVRLEKIWRQSDLEFLRALNLARAGKGKDAAEVLRELATWKVATDTNFDGTTIYAKNDDVDRHNLARYMKLSGKEAYIPSYRWGQQRKEWGIIPQTMRLKIGAYVMILTNAPFVPGAPLEYANGDCGWVTEIDKDVVFIKLARNGDVVEVPMLTRNVESKERPPEGTPIWAGVGRHNGEPYFDKIRRRWVYGGITYCPLRLAYATTVHKSQGLTLDRIQVDVRGHFFGAPNMAYVALSRVKSPQGLTIIGSPELLARKINVAPEVVRWV